VSHFFVNGCNIIDTSTNKIISNIFKDINIICTKKLSGGKSLENLYIEFFGLKFIGAHDAMVDVESTLKCYIELDKQDKQNKQNHQITTNMSEFIV